ncbi:MAG TPA: alkaline phosphatase family protein [Longimicrobium sp.]|nr:alkaline phosphatase family protein [Longimicrobium sp.]
MIRRLFLAAALATCAAAPAPAQARPAPLPERPKLLVFITVDQLRPDYFTRWGHQLNGGLARLWNGGAVFTDAHHDHAITETAPGHATTLAGRYPRGTGIVRNLEGVQDRFHPVIGGDLPGGDSAMGASPFRFRGSTLTDWMRLRDPRTRALSVSRKDRGAILPMGRAQQEVFWYAYDGRFSTSTWYADTLPTWVKRFNAEDRVRKLGGQAWTPLLPDTAYPEPDSVAYENRGRDFVFPHVLAADSAGAVRGVTEFPWMDAVTLELALAGLREMRLGERGATDVLAVSLSTTDAVGHRYGPDSREVHDQVLRLDRSLGAFLDSVYARFDSSEVVVALTADHGVTPFPEVRFGAGAARYHVYLPPLRAWINERLRAQGVDTTAYELDDGVLFVDRERFAAAGADPRALARAFVAHARTLPGVLRADLAADLAKEDTTARRVVRRWLHQLPPDLPVEAVVSLRPDHVWGTASSAQHGSPHEADTQVPILFYGPPFKPGKYGGYVRTVDIAPTLARVLRVTPTEPLDGRVLTEALR